MNIRWSATAIENLKSIRGYIARENSTAAARIGVRIRDAVENLGGFREWAGLGGFRVRVNL